jgi:hypothetical protein
LPNLISHQCFDFNELKATLAKILSGELGAADGEEHRSLVQKYLAARKGPLACDRIVDAIEGIVRARPELPKPELSRRALGSALANWRRFNRYARKYLPGKHAPEEFHRHRYPGISLQELDERISKLQRAIGDSTELKTDQISDQIFLMGP